MQIFVRDIRVTINETHCIYQAIYQAPFLESYY